MTHQRKHIRHSKYGKPFQAGLRYPSVAKIIATNRWIVENIPTTKAERYGRLASRERLQAIIDDAQRTKGSVKKKAGVLLYNLTKAHAFESANRRTAFSVARQFMMENSGIGPWTERKKTTRFLKGVREGKYSKKDVEEWLE